MNSLPHDVDDLALAPVVLALDRRIEELGGLDAKALSGRVALEANSSGGTRQLREDALLETLERFQHLHDWALSLDPRGVRLSHKERTLVLGLPPTFWEYLDGPG